jgi:hypothetical protein
MECGTGEHDEEKLKWGEWLKGDWETWLGRGFNTNHGGMHGGRGRTPMGAARGRDGGRVPGSWRLNAVPMIVILMISKILVLVL